MPNKYQREIEEILRNMERTEPRQGLGDRIRAFNRPRPRPRRELHWALNASETCILIGIALVLAVIELMALFALKTMVMQALAPH